jgi:hypothetical protein
MYQPSSHGKTIFRKTNVLRRARLQPYGIGASGKSLEFYVCSLVTIRFGHRYQSLLQVANDETVQIGEVVW